MANIIKDTLKELEAQEKTLEPVSETCEVTNNIIPKKRPNYQLFKANNWKKLNSNEYINLIDEKGGALWLSNDGDIYFRTSPHIKPVKKEPSKAEKVLSNIINKRLRLMRASEPDISELDLLLISEEVFDPQINQEFFKKNGIWYRNVFKPTEFMKMTQEPTKEPLTILRLIKHLVSDNEKYFEHFINWLAYFWQTMEKPNTAIVLIGEQGTGKGIFFDYIIRPLFGEEQTIQINNSILRNTYIAPFFKNKLFYNLDEISQGTFKENKKIKNFIKPLITNQSITLDEKFVSLNKSILIKGATLITSNEHIPLEIEIGDRRFNVFPSKIKIMQKGFLGFGTFDNFKYQIEQELADFAKYLYYYPVDPIKANTAIITPEKQALIEATNDKYTLFVTSLIQKNLKFFEKIEDDKPILYLELKADFEKNRIRKENIKLYFNTVFDENKSTQQIMKELKLRYPQIFNQTPIKSNGQRFYIIS
ncbi:primase-helicase family protein [Nitrosophilus kaiyonis]|uniref:primase-helicase family protein n=1 Tax=Nitrosophilus kaiyonis TaxID=2930200 RepID=UPI002492BDAE|nr:primase-helicase family protein [Nitrosophilus kaiyonis]